MAPPKTMAISQQQQQTNGRSNQGDQAPKSKKRKGKQQLTNNNSAQLHNQHNLADLEKQQVNDTSKSVGSAVGKENCDSKAVEVKQTVPQAKEQNKTVVTAPSERLSAKQQTNLAPSPREKESTNLVAAERKRDSIVPAQTQLAKQISTEEPDEIDAGIELDGSSNSSSSVKDMNEDQIKSASVSPVMAQNIILSENRDTAKSVVEVSPIEPITGAAGMETVTPPTKKIGSTKKQQLAANQQVIDADEQQLQQKLQSKQRKPSLQANISTGSHNSTTNNTPNSAPPSPALCKICDQHVYQMERMMAEKSVYHKSCFRCHQCKIQLRIDNYSSHDGQVYCKAHHRQIFQPQVKLDNEDDVDIVAKSTSKVVDDYLLQRGRLSDLSFSFLQPKPEGIRKRQMIICENEPAELPKDVVRSDTKVDDGIDRLKLNMSNILEKFERGTTGSGEESQPSSAGIVIEKPSFDIRKTLMAFEAQTVNSLDEDDDAKRAEKTEKPVVKKLTNLNGFLNRQSSTESESSTQVKPLAVKRSESLMMRLKKYESRIAGEQVVDDESDDDENNNSQNGDNISKKGDVDKQSSGKDIVPKKLASIDLSSLKNQWETGDISKRQFNEDKLEDEETNGKNTTSDKYNGYSPSAEKNEELVRIRQQLARKRSGGSSSIKNIYENAIKEAQQNQAPRLNSRDLSALNGLSTTEIQQQLLQNGSQDNQKSNTPPTPNKDHFQLNLSNKANKLKERFEQGLINNESYSDSDENDGGNERTMSKLEQIRQEKLEDLSIFTEGEIKAREARSIFQQIDRRLSAASSHRQSLPPNVKSLSTISASMQAKLQNQMSTINDNSAQNDRSNSSDNHLYKREQATEKQKPIRLMNNVRT